MVTDSNRKIKEPAIKTKSTSKMKMRVKKKGKSKDKGIKIINQNLKSLEYQL